MASDSENLLGTPCTCGLASLRKPGADGVVGKLIPRCSTPRIEVLKALYKDLQHLDMGILGCMEITDETIDVLLGAMGAA